MTLLLSTRAQNMFLIVNYLATYNFKVIILHQRFFEYVLQRGIIVYDGAHIVSFTIGHGEIILLNVSSILTCRLNNAAVVTDVVVATVWQSGYSSLYENI